MTEEKFKYSCNDCKDSGMITALDRKNKCNYTFRCGYCEAFKRKGYGLIPEWHMGLNDKYERYSEYQERGGWKE